MNRKNLCAILAACLLLLTFSGCRQTPPEADDAALTKTDGAQPAAEAVSVTIREINKHGTLILDTTFDALKAAGIEVGDVVTVFIGKTAYDLPVGTSYTDVDSGSMLCRFDLEDDEVGLAVNMGDFAGETGVAEKQTIEEDPGYRWDVKIPEIRLALKEKAGYLDRYNARNLARTNERADYAALSDAEFANFRVVAATGLGENVLYRSSSPLDPDLGRNEYAMAAMAAAGIRSVLNLGDSADAMRDYDAFPGSYYSACAVVNPEMGYDFGSAEFAEDVKDCVLFLIENDGPYLVHCKEGKDRTGILCAVLESFAGATAEEVKADYMASYANYFGVAQGDAAYDIILNDNLVKSLCGMFGVETMEDADLKEAAAAYLRGIGLTQTQLDLLAGRLTGA